MDRQNKGDWVGWLNEEPRQEGRGISGQLRSSRTTRRNHPYLTNINPRSSRTRRSYSILRTRFPEPCWPTPFSFPFPMYIYIQLLSLLYILLSVSMYIQDLHSRILEIRCVRPLI